MRKSVPKGNVHSTSYKGRFNVSDVPDYSTKDGAAKANSEMRRLAGQVQEAVENVEGKIADVDKRVPVTTVDTNTGGGKPKDGPPAVAFKLKTSHNGSVVVPETGEMDYVDYPGVGGVIWSIFNAGSGHAIVKGRVKLNDKLITYVQGECGIEPTEFIVVQRENDGLRMLHSCLSPCVESTDKDYLDYYWQPTAATSGGKSFTDMKLKIINQLFSIAYDVDGFHKTGQSVTSVRGIKLHDSAHITLELSETETNCFRDMNITPNLLYTAYIGENVGGYSEVYKETVSGTPSHIHKFRTIKEGSYIDITQSADYIEISCTMTPTTVTGDNLGAGTYHVYKNTTNVGTDYTLHFKTIEVAHDVFIYDNADVLTFDVDIQPYNLGSGAGVFWDKTHTFRTTNLNFRSIVEGAGISISTSPTEIIISCTVTDTNDTYSVNNLGTGAQVYKNVTSAGSAHTFNIRTIKSTDGSVTVVENSNEIDLSVDLPDPFVLSVYAENYTTPASWGTAVSPADSIRFGNYYNRVGVGYTQQIDDFDTYWTLSASPGASDAKVIPVTPNPMRTAHLNTGGSTTFTSNPGQRVFAFRDTATATFTVSEDTDANGWRRSVVTVDVEAPADPYEYIGANLGGEVGEPYISTTGVAPNFTHNFRTIGAYDASVYVYQIGNTILIQASTDIADMDNVGGFTEVYKDYTDTGSSRTFHLRTIQSSNGSISIIQNTNDIDIQVNDTFSITSHVEFTTSPDSYNVVSTPMRELRFSHYFNRPSFTVSPDDFDSLWIVDEFPGSGQTRAKVQVPNPLRTEHQNSGGTALFTTNVGQRKIAFQDTSAITFGVSETTDADGYRQSIIVANFTDEATIIREYAVDNVGGFNEIYKNYTDAGSLRTFHLRTIQSSDGSVTITQNTNDIDLQVPDTYDLTVGYGGSTGPTLNFAGATMGVVNSVDTHLIWFAGDNASFEGGGGALGLHGDLPSFDVVFLVDNNDAPWTVGNPYLGNTETVRVKARVTPLFHAWDDYTETTLAVNTTDHLTRMEFVDTATMQARVSQHGTYTHGVKVELSVKEGTSVQKIRVRQNSTGTGNSQPRINLIDNNYSVWTLTNDTVDNEHDISIQPKLGFKLDSGSLAYRKDVKFITGSGVTLTEDTSNADEYRITIARPLTIKDDGVNVVANTVETINFNDSDNDITTIVSLDADPKRVNVTSQFCGYGTKWDTPLFCDPSGAVNYITNFATATWSYPIWFDQELTEDTQGWVDNPTLPSPRWQFKPSRKGRYHVHVLVRFRVADPTNDALPVRMDLPQLAVFKNGAMDTMLDADEMSVRYNEFIDYAVVTKDWDEGSIHPISTFTLHGGTTMQLEADDYIEFRLRHETGADKYIELLYGWTSIDYVGRCNDTLDTPTATYFTDP